MNESPEWAAQAAREPYRIGYRFGRVGRPWFVYDVRTEAKVGTFATNDAAVQRVNELNAIEAEERARRRRLLIEWNAFVNGRETSEAELRSLDGDR